MPERGDSEQCPYCKVRPKRRKTCGAPECQHRYHVEQERKYYDKYLRKTGRRILSRAGKTA